jgi:hypothetical protein
MIPVESEDGPDIPVFLLGMKWYCACITVTSS